MDGNGFNFPLDVEDEASEASVVSIEQLRRLVQLLDASDVTELELKRASDGMRLALRKVKAPETSATPGTPLLTVATQAQEQADSPAATKEQEKTRKVVAPLVGTFHVWARPRGGALVAVGDKVKAGQLLCTIESLNVLNEVESPVAGKVTEVHAQEGQPVEYGQHLMTIEVAEGAKKG